jgi:hypothetical protein
VNPFFWVVSKFRSFRNHFCCLCPNAIFRPNPCRDSFSQRKISGCIENTVFAEETEGGEFATGVQDWSLLIRASQEKSSSELSKRE